VAQAERRRSARTAACRHASCRVCSSRGSCDRRRASWANDRVLADGADLGLSWVDSATVAAVGQAPCAPQPWRQVRTVGVLSICATARYSLDSYNPMLKWQLLARTVVLSSLCTGSVQLRKCCAQPRCSGAH
jgi:hypothetical protein